MEKTYQPEKIETQWYQYWEQEGHFSPAPGSESYCIMIPPPNVTGSLHMGHAFQYTIMDTLIRYHRMKGKETLWQMGCDHAGIATQMVVERQLLAEEKTRHDLGREAFVDKIWEWKEQSGGTISRQLRRMGASVDWSRERFTMDDGLSESVREVFVTLFDEGLIYRGKRLVNWDPVLHTAVSDLEVVSEEESGFLWHMRYPVIDGQGNTGSDYLVVATTRPETLLGDAAVAVHPDDERYQSLIGQFVELPLTGRQIPVIADTYVDPEFGSGCVKITPAHDFNDHLVGKRHQLPELNIFTADAAINDEAPAAYRGMDRFDARKQIIADLEALGLLEKIDDHKLMVPRGDRSGAVIEPLLTDQWFVKAGPLAEKAVNVVESGEIQFVPDNWKNTYYEWMRNIEDWCISRQIWWGHRIPAWYDSEGNIYVAHDEEAVRKKYQLADEVVLRQDDDVLDTWFSSALWPFSTLGWPEKTAELETFYPTNVLVTGFDIIFFWVARMIMMGLKFTGEVPFKHVYIHGLVRDADGQKMSKSKGNVLDPLDIIDGISLDDLVAKRTTGLMQPGMAKKIEKVTKKQFPDGIAAFGTDALRFTFAALATTGRDIRLDLHRIDGYRNFCNKLWNASRFVLLNSEDQDTGANDFPRELSLADRWIISRLQVAESAVVEHIESYRFDLAAQVIYEFTWNDYCDWYLELSKVTLNDPVSSDEQLRGSRATLVRVLEALLRLAHPIMPFITEEIWQRVAPLAGKRGATIMIQPYPQSDVAKIDDESIELVEWLKQVILGVRRIRGEMNISPGKPLPVLIKDGSVDDQNNLKLTNDYLRKLAKVELIRWLEPADEVPEAAISLVGNMKVLIPLAGLIDKDAELARLDKEKGKLEKDLLRSESKLNNPSFVERAPAEVVATETVRVEEMRLAMGSLVEQREKIARL